MVSRRESIFAWIGNWLRDKKERVEINRCFFRQRTRVPQELVMSLVFYSTQYAHPGHTVHTYAGPALSMGDSQTSQTQPPSGEARGRKGLVTSPCSQKTGSSRGLRYQDTGDRTGDGGWGRGKSSRQQSESLRSRISSVTDLLCGNGQVPSLSGS